MKKYICDRCGRNILSDYDVFSVRILDAVTQHNQFIALNNDICKKCAKDIAEYVKKQPNEPESEVKTEAETKAEEKRKVGRPKKEDKAVDLGKVKALRDAGWSFQDIAKEMDLSDEQTTYALVELWRQG